MRKKGTKKKKLYTRITNKFSVDGTDIFLKTRTICMEIHVSSRAPNNQLTDTSEIPKHGTIICGLQINDVQMSHIRFEPIVFNATAP